MDGPAERRERRAGLLGLLPFGANPKNFVLTASAATSVVEAGTHSVDLALAVLVFVLLGSCTVLSAVVVHLTGGRRAEVFLDSVRQFMVANSTVIMVIPSSATDSPQSADTRSLGRTPCAQGKRPSRH
ncbi:GAP family protein [Streptomyces chryseus]